MPRKTRKKTKVPKEKVLEPLDIFSLGGKDDPCFGKLYDLGADECKRCGDSELCSVAFAQNQNITRKKLEAKQEFKDLDNNDKVIAYMKRKQDKGVKKVKLIRLTMEKFEKTKEEVKTLYLNL